MTERTSELRFNALRIAIYHTARRMFFETATRYLNFVVVASGGFAFANLLDGWGLKGGILAAVAALAGLMQLVGDFGSRARTHEFLQRRFYEIVAEIAEAKNPGASKFDGWEAALNRLYAEEPPPMRALDAVAYNAAVDATDIMKKGRISLRWWHVAFKQFFSFGQTAF